MEPFVQLNLQSDSEKADPANLPNPERKNSKSLVLSKRLHRLVNKAAHKAVTQRNRTGLDFSKQPGKLETCDKLRPRGGEQLVACRCNKWF